MARKRVIYQSEALFTTLNQATDFHILDDAVAVQTTAEIIGQASTNVIQLRNIQSASYSFTINYEDVNELGSLGAIDQVALTAPTVSLDFSYLLTDGFNEKLLGFDISGAASAIADIANGTKDEKNYFILTVGEGEDAAGNTSRAEHGIFGIGNGFISNYSIEAAVGGIPSASVTIEALNMNAVSGSWGAPIPAINAETGTKLSTTEYILPPAEKTDKAAGDLTHLEPGDITLTLSNPFGASVSGAGSCHIQSVSISVPLSREPLERLGSRFPFSREITFPAVVSFSVNANMADIVAGNLADVLCTNADYDLALAIKEPSCEGTGVEAIKFQLKGAKLESQNFSTSIGSNKTVELSFTGQISGPNDTAKGFFITGKEGVTPIAPIDVANV